MQVLARSVVATAVSQEILRLADALIWQQRTAERDTVIGDIEVPAGTNVWLSVKQARVLSLCPALGVS